MPKLDYYRRLAEDLLTAQRAGEQLAARRFVLYHPQFRDLPRSVARTRPVRLVDAQLVVAREARFDSWPELKQSIEALDASPQAMRFETAVDAVVDGDTNTLRGLLDVEPSLAKARSPRGHRATLLHYSSANGVEDDRQKIPANAVAVADLLMSAGADINATADFYGRGPGSTPLVGLVTSAHPAAAGLMDDLVRSFAKSGQNLNGVDDDGLPIVHALLSRHVTAARTLAECGARVDNAAVAAGIGRADLVERLVGDAEPPEADPGALPQALGKKIQPTTAAQYALLFAAVAGEAEIARFLVARGTDVKAPLHHDRTPLHEAAGGNHLELVRLLVDAGASAEARDGQFGLTPIGWAAQAGHAAVVEYFVEHCSVSLIDLVRLGRPDLVRRQLDRHPADANAVESRGVPLWVAAATGDPELVRLLLEQGADATLTDPEGKTALDWATALGHDEIVAMLREHS